jgi:hypothetical protein
MKIFFKYGFFISLGLLLLILSILKFALQGSAGWWRSFPARQRTDSGYMRYKREYDLYLLRQKESHPKRLGTALPETAAFNNEASSERILPDGTIPGVVVELVVEHETRIHYVIFDIPGHVTLRKAVSVPIFNFLKVGDVIALRPHPEESGSFLAEWEDA